jgi:hypothetical protein
MLLDLIESFDDEGGISAATFCAVNALISNLMGRSAAEIFNQHMDACEDRYYFKDAETASACWQEMCESMKRPRRRSHVIKRNPFPA